MGLDPGFAKNDEMTLSFIIYESQLYVCLNRWRVYYFSMHCRHLSVLVTSEAVIYISKNFATSCSATPQVGRSIDLRQGCPYLKPCDA